MRAREDGTWETFRRQVIAGAHYVRLSQSRLSKHTGKRPSARNPDTGSDP
jgi:hypothetical protein